MLNSERILKKTANNRQSYERKSSANFLTQSVHNSWPKTSQLADTLKIWVCGKLGEETFVCGIVNKMIMIRTIKLSRTRQKSNKARHR